MRALYMGVGIVAALAALPAMIFGFSMSMSMETGSLWWIPTPACIDVLVMGVCFHKAGATQ